MFYNPNIHRCEHIKANGTQCGSPALRHKKLCYFHARWQDHRLAIADSVANIPAGTSIGPALNMPVLEDANSIQVAIMQTVSLLLTGQLEHKTAALVLYALQTASSNLRHTRFEPHPPNVVINPDTIDQTLMGEDVWKNSDFNIEDEGEEGDEDDGNTSPEENVRNRALEEYSAETNSEEEPDPQQNNWDELRTQIATMVKQAALQECLEDKLTSERYSHPEPGSATPLRVR